MSIRNALATTFVKLAKRVKHTNYVFGDDVMYDLHPSNYEDYSRDSMTNLMSTYQNILWVFCGVNTIATNAAMVPLKIHRVSKGGEREEVKDHPVLDLFNNANLLNTRFELFVKTFAYLELCGNSYWFMEHATDSVAQEVFGDAPIKIHIERPDRVEPSSQNNSERVKYQRKVNDKTVTFRQDEVVHFTHFNPYSMYTGLPTIAAGQDSLIMEMYITTFGKRFFENSVRPSMVFTTDSELTDAAFERFKILIERQYKGADNAHQMMLLGGGLRPLDLAYRSPTDADFARVNILNRDKILNNLGCYHIVALNNGESGDAARHAYRMFWQDTMLPRLANVSQTITKEMLPFYGEDNLVAEYDTRSVSGLREDFMDESLGYFRFIQGGIMTPNEVRRKLGLEGDVEGGDTPGLGYEPAVSRFVSNEERAETERQVERAESRRRESNVANNGQGTRKKEGKIDFQPFDTFGRG